MGISKILIILGLALNTVASIIILCPYLKISRNVEDLRILNMEKEKGEYTQRKHIKNQRFGIVGFILFAIGFFVQIMGVLKAR